VGKVDYAVFRALDSEGTWAYLGAFEAHSAEAAEKAACGKAGADGEYVAVPASSWSPSNYEVVTTTTVRPKK